MTCFLCSPHTTQTRTLQNKHFNHTNCYAIPQDTCLSVASVIQDTAAVEASSSHCEPFTGSLVVASTLKNMKASCLAVSLLLWSLGHSQIFPYISFMDQTLANHSYVDLSLVGEDVSGVQCHTDLDTCCSSDQGIYRGDWYFPNKTILPFPGGEDIFENHAAQSVHLHRRNKPSPTGMYRCDIPTTVVHDDTDTSVRESVYVGLYADNGRD